MDAIEAAARALTESTDGPWEFFNEDGHTASRIQARATVIAFLRAYVPSENAITVCATGDPRDVLEAIADELEAS